MLTITNRDIADIDSALSGAADNVMTALHAEQCRIIERESMSPPARLEAVLQLQTILLATERATAACMRRLHAD